MKRDPAVINLLLATAFLRHDNTPRALEAKRAWLDIMLQMDTHQKVPCPRAALAFLRAACQLCAAADVEGLDMVQAFNDAREARIATADLDSALDNTADALLRFLMARMPEVEQETAA